MTSPLPDSSKSPIFLLKTKSTPHDGYDEYFSSRIIGGGRYEPHFIPVLEHKFHDANLATVKDLLVSGSIREKYGGLIFTSQRAVEGFASVIGDVRLECADSFNLYSVGPATHRSLTILRNSHFPHAPVIGEDAGTGDKLASLILEHYNGLDHVTGTGIRSGESKKDKDRARGTGKLPLLFLVGEQHRDVIPKTLMSPDLPVEQRIQVEELVVYETGVMETFAMAFADALQDTGAWGTDDGNSLKKDEAAEGGELRSARTQSGEDRDNGSIWIAVFSPTGCDTMLQTLNLLPSNEEEEAIQEGKNDPTTAATLLKRNCYIATIGPTTRDHLRLNFGIEPDVCAERPSPEGLGRGIEMFMAEKKERGKLGSLKE